MNINDARSSRDDDKDIPSWLRWSFISINRVGFPIVVSVALFWYLGTTQKKLASSLDRQALSLEALTMTINVNHAEGKEWRNQILEDMHEIRAGLRK